MHRVAPFLFSAALLLGASDAAAADDPLPSWNDGATRSAIVALVDNVTDEDSPAYVPPAERITTFDNQWGQVH